MPQDLIRYDLLVQEALKGVVRKILTDAAVTGLPGDHHFYVSFRTEDPGVRISQRLREKYPEEMTIVLQHQFWDLAVTEHTFEVGLSFSGIPERLLVPFDALTGFFDPSVQFGLKFDLSGAEPADNDEETEEDRPEPAPPTALPSPAMRKALAAKGEADKASGDLADVRENARRAADKAKRDGGQDTAKTAGKKTAADGKSAEKADAAKDDAGKGDAGKTDATAEVVSLDAFRKKT